MTGAERRSRRRRARQIVGPGRAGDLGPVAQPLEAERRRRAAGPVARVERHRRADQAAAGERRRPRRGRRPPDRPPARRRASAASGRRPRRRRRRRSPSGRARPRAPRARRPISAVSGSTETAPPATRKPRLPGFGTVVTSGPPVPCEGGAAAQPAPTPRASAGITRGRPPGSRWCRSRAPAPPGPAAACRPGTAAEDQPGAVRHPHREIAGAADVERARHRREVAERRPATPPPRARAARSGCGNAGGSCRSSGPSRLARARGPRAGLARRRAARDLGMRLPTVLGDRG